jgi:FtsZ-interacting cell division protein ZipA
MRLSKESRQSIAELLCAVAGAVVLVALVFGALWACSASSGSSTGCNRAYCAEPDSDGPDHPDLEDVYDYDPLEDQLEQQRLDDADRQQELEDARQEGYEEGQQDGR